METQEEFRQYWKDLWVRLRAQGAVGDGEEICETLIQRYSESQRHYHTLRHVVMCLRHFPIVCARCTNPEVAELAICFHDVVYDPRGHGNEEQSAELARVLLKQHGLGLLAESVADLVMATKLHHSDSEAGKAVIDLDLGIMGASSEAFDEYCRAIRREYAHVPAILYFFGRRRVLRKYLNRVPIYQLPEMRERFETQAKENLRCSLAWW